MIKAQDLRIGNLVQADDGNVNEILEIRQETLRCKYIRQDTDQPHVSLIYHAHLFGIPLTEQWLLRVGFEARGNEYFKRYTEKEEFVLTVDNDDYYLAEYDECYGFQAVYQPLLYVHQLQNVIHALTGQELEFKD